MSVKVISRGLVVSLMICLNSCAYPVYECREQRRKCWPQVFDTPEGPSPGEECYTPEWEGYLCQPVKREKEKAGNIKKEAAGEICEEGKNANILINFCRGQEDCDYQLKTIQKSICDEKKKEAKKAGSGGIIQHNIYTAEDEKRNADEPTLWERIFQQKETTNESDNFNDDNYPMPVRDPR